jgi:hypothetical protein
MTDLNARITRNCGNEFCPAQKFKEKVQRSPLGWLLDLPFLALHQNRERGEGKD